MRPVFRSTQRRRPPADPRSLANRGRWFQDHLESICDHYRYLRRAYIWPVPVPMRLRPNRGGSYFRKRKSSTDFLGYLSNGRGVAFDAKSTTGDQWEANVPQHQVDTLELIAELGHLSGLMVGYAGHHSEPPRAVWVPWPSAKALTTRSGWTYSQCAALPGAIAILWRMWFDFLPALEQSAAALPPLNIGKTS